MSSEIIGRTAVHARSLAATARNRVLLLLLGLGLLGCGLLLAWRSGSPLLLPLLLLAAPAALFSLALLQRSQVEYARAAAGVRAEERVCRALARLQVPVVLNGVLLGRGDIDHVVLGPAVFAVETKHGSGPLALDRFGVLTVNGRRLPRDPVQQARANAERLSRHLRLDVVPVVVVPDGAGAAFRAGDVYVCSLRTLADVIAAVPARITRERALGLAGSLTVAG